MTSIASSVNHILPSSKIHKLDEQYNGYQKKKKIISFIIVLNKLLQKKINLNDKKTIDLIIGCKGILYTDFILRLLTAFQIEQYNMKDKINNWNINHKSIISHNLDFIKTKQNIKWSYLHFNPIQKKTGIHTIKIKRNKDRGFCFGLSYSDDNTAYKYFNKDTISIHPSGHIFMNKKLLIKHNFNDIKYFQMIYDSFENTVTFLFRNSKYNKFQVINTIKLSFTSNKLYPFIGYINNASQLIEFY